MPRLCTRIEGVDAPIDEAIERHRRAAREDHAKQNSDKVEPAEWSRLPGKNGTQKCERQCEDRMAKSDHFQNELQAPEHRGPRSVHLLKGVCRPQGAKRPWLPQRVLSLSWTKGWPE